MIEAAIRFRDDPWPRLPWLVPAALVLTLLSQMGFLSLLRQPATNTAIPRPVDVQVVELPVPGPPAAARPAPSTPTARRTPPMPKPRVEPPAPRPAAPPTETRVALPQDPTPPTAEEPAPQGPAALATVSTPPATPAPSTSEGPPTQAPVAAVPPSPQGAPGGTGNMSARAIYQPVPEIPEALRHNTIELVAVARFRVAASGAAQVELTGPTGDPNLNRALLEALARWRFFPAMQGGKPVASTIDIRIPISVK